MINAKLKQQQQQQHEENTRKLNKFKGYRLNQVCIIPGTKSLTLSANKKRQEIILSQFTGMETTFYVKNSKN